MVSLNPTTFIQYISCQKIKIGGRIKMKTKYLKIKKGIAESNCIFEQETARGVSFKVIICIAKELNYKNIRASNALKVATYQLQKEIQKDKNFFDRCYRSNTGWDYKENMLRCENG